MEILDILKDFGLPIGTGMIGYFTGKPRSKADTEGVHVDNAGKVIDKWSGYSERLEKNIEQLSNVIDDLRDALTMAKDEGLACRQSLNKLQTEYDKLLKLYEDLKMELDSITTSNRMHDTA